MWKERYLIIMLSVGLFYDGTDPKVAAQEGNDIEDLGTPEADEAKRFDKYEEADSFIKNEMPGGEIMYQIVKVTIK